MLEAKQIVRESAARPSKELPLEYNEGQPECTLALNVFKPPTPERQRPNQLWRHEFSIYIYRCHAYIDRTQEEW